MPKPAPEHPETQVIPEPELEKRSRRRFSTEFKLRVIARADACQYGELGELLRSEGLYSGQLQQWRKELAAGGEKHNRWGQVLFRALGVQCMKQDQILSLPLKMSPSIPVRRVPIELVPQRWRCIADGLDQHRTGGYSVVVQTVGVSWGQVCFVHWVFSA